MPDNLSRTVAVTGHYGSGKTNLSLNIAFFLKSRGRKVTLADLDVVNPYFRGTDFKELAATNDIHLIAPGYAGSNLDIPALTGELGARLGGEDTVIIDVGGDGDGAYALGRYAPEIAGRPYDMIFTVNFFRLMTKTPEQAAAYMREIEAACRLKVTAIVNNSNMADMTTPEDIAVSIQKAGQLSDITQRPLLFSSVRSDLAEQMNLSAGDIFPVQVYVKTPWSR